MTAVDPKQTFAFREYSLRIDTVFSRRYRVEDMPRPALTGFLLLLVHLAGMSHVEAEEAIEVVTIDPPPMSEAVEALQLISQPYVIRSRVVALDGHRLAEVLLRSMNGGSNESSVYISFPLFQDILLSVSPVYVKTIGSELSASIAGAASSQLPAMKSDVGGVVRVSVETGSINGSFIYGERAFLLVPTGDGPYHAVMEVERCEMPNVDCLQGAN